MLSILLIVGSNKAAKKVNYSDILSFPSFFYLQKFFYIYLKFIKVVSNSIYCFVPSFHLAICYGPFFFFQVITYESNYFYWLCGISIVRAYHNLFN